MPKSAELWNQRLDHLTICGQSSIYMHLEETFCKHHFFLIFTLLLLMSEKLFEGKSPSRQVLLEKKVG